MKPSCLTAPGAHAGAVEPVGASARLVGEADHAKQTWKDLVKSIILYNNDMSSVFFLKFMCSISVSKYGVTVYTVHMDFTHLHFALVKILANQKTERLLWLVQNLNACPAIDTAPIFHRKSRWQSSILSTGMYYKHPRLSDKNI